MGRRGRRVAERPPRSRAPLVLAVVAVTAILVTLAAAAYWPDRAPTPASADGRPSHSPSAPQAQLDLRELPVSRTLDCSLIDDEALHAAVGGPVTRRDSYRNGDRAEVAPGVTDVAHEDGCVFAGPDAEARVWVFAAPVGTAEAKRLIRGVRRDDGCGRRDITTGFGKPDLVEVCRAPAPGADAKVTVATLRGLFGDAWLSCQVSDSDGAKSAEVLSRAEQWCVHVATTLGARP